MNPLQNTTTKFKFKQRSAYINGKLESRKIAIVHIYFYLHKNIKIYKKVYKILGINKFVKPLDIRPIYKIS